MRAEEGGRLRGGGVSKIAQRLEVGVEQETGNGRMREVLGEPKGWRGSFGEPAGGGERRGQSVFTGPGHFEG